MTTSGVPDSTTLYYSIATVSGITLTSADFTTGDVDGSFTITSNSGSFVLRPVGDDLPESNVAKVQIRRGSTSGDILGESENLTISDAAAPSGAPEFNWRYYAYGSNINETYILWVQSNGTQNTLEPLLDNNKLTVHHHNTHIRIVLTVIVGQQEESILSIRQATVIVKTYNLTTWS